MLLQHGCHALSLTSVPPATSPPRPAARSCRHQLFHQPTTPAPGTPVNVPPEREQQLRWRVKLLSQALWSERTQLSPTLQLAGKLHGGLPLVAAVSPPDTNDPDCCLLTIFDSHFRTFLIDTGAQVSVVPVTAKGRPAPSSGTNNPTLHSAKSSTILVHDTTDIELHLAGRKFNAGLLHTEVDLPLLGADFFHRHHLLVDICNRCLVDTRRWSCLPCSAATPSTSSRLQPITTGENSFLTMLSEFPELTRLTFNVRSPGHGVEYHILSTGPPTWSCPSRLSPEKLRATRNEFAAMMGIMCPSSSPWSSPLHMVPKSSSAWRPCGNIR